jgi:hypothetical protein
MHAVTNRTMPAALSRADRILTVSHRTGLIAAPIDEPG